MTKLYFLLIGSLTIASINMVQAQTIHDVSVVNGLFNPAALQIETGDIVRWTNNEGFHAVDGNETDFPDNPVPFGNEAGAAGWEYEFTFDEAGAYAYRCGVHTTTMFGIIAVGLNLGVAETYNANELSFYPNPVVNQLSWKASENQTSQNQMMRMFDINGMLVAEFSLFTAIQFDVSTFENGMYFYSVSENNTAIQTGKFLIAR